VTSVLLGAAAATNLQQVYTPRVCPGCTEFKKMTHEFEKDVITAVSVGNPDTVDEDRKNGEK